jgi:endoglucanase
MAQPQVSAHIHIDQFGYRPGDQKVAVISDPITGYNNALSFQPGGTYEVREWNSQKAVTSGIPTTWNNGQEHDQSGDRVWWFDFSTLVEPGDYYVYDPANDVRSHLFTIGDCVYNDALQAATRAFFYQRCGGPKPVANAGTGWSDTFCHLGALQDSDCRNAQNPTAASARDLRGGWHDAGDHNKYVNWTFGVLTDLLLAYEENPSVWGDDNNIPESGNGTPDLLDEARWELDWLMRMSQDDGSTFAKVAVTLSADDNISPPSVDQNERRYSGPSTSSAFTVAAVCALGAIHSTRWVKWLSRKNWRPRRSWRTTGRWRTPGSLPTTPGSRTRIPKKTSTARICAASQRHATSSRSRTRPRTASGSMRTTAPHT